MKKQRILLTLLLVCTAAAAVQARGLPPAAAREADFQTMKLTVGSQVLLLDGEAKKTPAPEIRNGRTMIPIRAVAEAAGARVDYEEATRTVVITGAAGETIRCPIGRRTMTVGARPCALDVAPYIKNNRTFLPLRFVCEALGLQVAWDAAERSITITPPAAAEFAGPAEERAAVPLGILAYQYSTTEAVTSWRLCEGHRTEFRALLPAGYAGEVVWRTSDESVLRLEAAEGGRVFAVPRTPGTALLTLQSADGLSSASCAVEVYPVTYTLPASPLRMKAGKSQTVEIGSSAWVRYEVADRKVADCKVNWRDTEGMESVTVTGLAPGKTELRILPRFADQSKTASLPIVVEPAGPADPVLTALSVEAGAERLTLGETTAVAVYAIAADGSREDVTAQAVLTSGDPSVLRLNGNGVMPLAAGQAEVRAEFGGLAGAVTLTVESGLTLALSETEHTCYLDDIDCRFSLGVSTNAADPVYFCWVDDITLLYVPQSDRPNISARMNKVGDTTVHVRVTAGDGQTATASCRVHLRERYDRNNRIAMGLAWWRSAQGQYPHLNVTYAYHPMGWTLTVTDRASGTVVLSDRGDRWLGTIDGNFGDSWDLSGLPAGAYTAVATAVNSFGRPTTETFDFDLP